MIDPALLTGTLVIALGIIWLALGIATVVSALKGNVYVAIISGVMLLTTLDPMLAIIIGIIATVIMAYFGYREYIVAGLVGFVAGVIILVILGVVFGVTIMANGALTV